MKACLQWINSSVPEKINYFKCYNRMRNLHKKDKLSFVIGVRWIQWITYSPQAWSDISKSKSWISSSSSSNNVMSNLIRNIAPFHIDIINHMRNEAIGRHKNMKYHKMMLCTPLLIHQYYPFSQKYLLHPWKKQALTLKGRGMSL